MQEVLAQTVAELRALGLWCLIHGPEAWLALVALCVYGIGVISGLFLAALLGANREDNDK